MAKATTAGAAGAPPAELAYRAKVTLPLTKNIRPCMRVLAEVKTGDRRVLEYLLSPVMQAVKEARGRNDRHESSVR